MTKLALTIRMTLNPKNRLTAVSATVANVVVLVVCALSVTVALLR